MRLDEVFVLVVGDAETWCRWLLRMRTGSTVDNYYMQYHDGTVWSTMHQCRKHVLHFVHGIFWYETGEHCPTSTRMRLPRGVYGRSQFKQCPDMHKKGRLHLQLPWSSIHRKFCLIHIIFEIFRLATQDFNSKYFNVRLFPATLAFSPLSNVNFIFFLRFQSGQAFADTDEFGAKIDCRTCTCYDGSVNCKEVEGW